MDSPSVSAREAAKPARSSCPACFGHAVADFMELGEVPVHCNVLFDSVEAALAAFTGRLTSEGR